jgi:hypothetical protein
VNDTTTRSRWGTRLSRSTPRGALLQHSDTIGPEPLSRQQMFNQLCQGFSAVQKATYPAATAGSGDSGLFALASVDTLNPSRPCGLMTTTTKSERMNRLLTVRLADNELALLREIADERQQSMTAIVRESLRAAGVPIAA